MALPRHEKQDEILAAIDVGTNAVRLELARILADGTLETLHTERDPVRPGEGLFSTGRIADPVADRLVSTLRRYAALCKRYGARVRAVATSALRDAKNREEVVRRVRTEAGLSLEVVSGREEARLICLGVLHGKPATQKSLCIDLGGGSTEVIYAKGETPKDLWSLDIGAVRMTELFALKDRVARKQLTLMRNFAREAIEEAIPGGVPGAPGTALGSSGTIGAVVSFARAEGVGHATTQEVSRAVEYLADMDAEKRRKRFDPRRADIVVAGSVILESALKHLKLQSITAVDRGLREGVLLDLVRKQKHGGEHSVAEAAITVGRRFGFGEAHALQVADLCLKLFDELTSLHQLPPSARPLLEAAALLHDIGHAVDYRKHHKHTHYLILNTDMPGVSDRERQIVGAIARFHRRSPPLPNHEILQGFTVDEVRTVRRCAVLLRVADSLDRSHHQPVKALSVSARGKNVVLKLKARQSLDLELWDVQHEQELFREVFGKPLLVQTERGVPGLPA